MAASPRIPALVANAMLNAGIGDQANSGKLKLYSGAQPLSGGGAITTQTLLAQFTMAGDAFQAGAGGVIVANAVTAAVGLADGVAAWFRLTKADGSTTLLDGSVGVAGDSPDLVIEDVTISLGEAVAVTSFTVTMPLT